VFPVSQLVESSVFETRAGPAEPLPLPEAPHLVVTGAEGQEGGGRKLHLRAVTFQPCWGTLNITGAGHKLLGWSFTSGAPPVDELAGSGLRQHVVRFTTELQEGGLDFWLLLGGAGRVRVELNVMFIEPVTGATEAVLRALPGWVGPMLASHTYQSTFLL
jgi:hypothetical protein